MQSNEEFHSGIGQVQALSYTSDMKGVTVCSISKYDTIETERLWELEEGVNIQHCESGVHISREVSVRPQCTKAWNRKE